MSIRDILALIFGSKAATELEPRVAELEQSSNDDLAHSMDVLIARMRASGLFPDAAINAVPPPKPQQHPLAPELNPPPLDWANWSRMARENQRRGWSFARYAVRGPAPEVRMGCVFGIVRGPWGICKMDFFICGAGRFDTLNAITHLPSGMGCGLFTDQETAAAACDIAARLADDWEALDPYADGRVTGQAINRMHNAWVAAGLIKCDTHAHATADTDSESIPIWFQNYSTIVAGRPERLS